MKNIRSASRSLVFVVCTCALLAPRAYAITSTWTGATDDNWFSNSNWIGDSPGASNAGFGNNDVAVFGPTGSTTPQMPPNPIPYDIGTILFPAGAQSYTLTIKSASRLHVHSGIINGSSAHQTIVNESRESFSEFGAELFFRESAGILSSAAGLTIVNQLNHKSGGGIASIPSVNFSDNSAAGIAIFDNHSRITFRNSSSAALAQITTTNGSGWGGVLFLDDSTAGSASIVNKGDPVDAAVTSFQNNAMAGTATIVNQSGPNFGHGGQTHFTGNASAGNATINNNGVFGGGSLGAEERSGMTTFGGNSTAGNATITNSAGGAGLMGGTTVFNGHATAGNARLDTRGNASGVGGVTRFLDFAGGGNATAITGLNGIFDISGLSALGMGIGSIAGAGHYVLGSKQFLVGSNNTSTTVSGRISGDGGALRKTGSGSLRLLGANTYSGFTSIFDGSLIAANTAGSATGPGTVFVMAGGTLAGGNPTGTSGFIAGDVSVAGSGHIAPGLAPATAGLLTLHSDLSLDDTATLAFQLLTPNLFDAPGNDRLSVAGNLILDGILDIDTVPGFGGAGAYRLISYGGDLTNNGLALGTLPAGFDPSDFLIDVSQPGEVILRVGPTQPPAVPGPASALLVFAGSLSICIGRWFIAQRRPVAARTRLDARIPA